MTLIRTLGVLSAVVLGAAMLAGPAYAQTQVPDGFVQMGPEDLGQEGIPAAPLLLTAYAFVWVALLSYVFVLWRRLGRVEKELADVAARLRAQSKG